MSNYRQQIYRTDDGEVVSDKEYEPKKKHHRYYLTFYSALAKANKSLSYMMILILGQMDGKNLIVVDKNRLNGLRGNYSLSIGSLKMTISRMCTEGLIQRIAPALYFANPYYFTKSNLHKLDELRREYSEILFNTKQRTTKKKQITNIEKQISDINKVKTDPVSQAKRILKDTEPFER